MKIKGSLKLGVVCRGGPHNGPFSAGFFRTFKPLLAAAGMRIAGIYADSGPVATAVLTSVGREEEACKVWADLKPGGIISIPRGWFVNLRRKGAAAYNLMSGWSVFDSTPLAQLLERLIPLDEVFSPDAIPVTFAAVDYFTGKQLVFTNRDKRHRPQFVRGMLSSKALVPFLPPFAVVRATQDGIMEGPPHTLRGELADVALGMDAGYVDNLLLEQACRDGMDVILVVDLNGLQTAPLGTERPERWSDFLQRAFNILVTTNDRRRLRGVERTNEAIAARDEIRSIARKVKGKLRARLERVAARMDRELVEGKRRVRVHMVSTPSCAIPFDFANFTHAEADHLIGCGHRAALDTARALGLPEGA